jgi:hypothetical protein
VTLDGREVGLTPLRREVLTGEHELVLSAVGHDPATRRALVEAGQAQLVRVELGLAPIEPEPPPVPLTPRERLRAPRPRWRLVIGGLAIGGGLLMSGFGVSALSTNGACTTPSVAPMSACGYLYSTAGVGGGLLAAGLVLSLGGAGMMAWPGQAARSQLPRAALPRQLEKSAGEDAAK